jgi:hypothetical protein
MNNQERKVCYKCFPTLVPKGNLMEPFVNNQTECSKLKTLLGEFFCLSQNIKFIPLFEPKELLLWKHMYRNKQTFVAFL